MVYLQLGGPAPTVQRISWGFHTSSSYTSSYIQTYIHAYIHTYIMHICNHGKSSMSVHHRNLAIMAQPTLARPTKRPQTDACCV
mmetsp:Transcript_108515/g.187559  ORF Transcript_108515/g.187559 Transcript_108515/m.187559 type:complete len:84 (-) Transcript_108515:399-650(-)